MFEQIVATLDGSEYGERALRYVRDLATITGARVALLSVIGASERASLPPAAAPDDSRGEHRLSYLEQHAEALRIAGVSEATAEVQFGDDPARLITEFARSRNADLIVMSTQGLGADDRYGLGSVALQVLMTAHCPVFMTRINRPEPPRTLAEERWQGEGGANVG